MTFGSATDSAMVLQATIDDLVQRGVHVQGWIHTACELQGVANGRRCT
jgi:hypothetical protein